MRQLPIDLAELETIMQFGLPDLEGEQQALLDLQTGEIVCIWESDEACAATLNEEPESNAQRREAVEADPERYAPIPEREANDPNDLMREFLDSRWTEDDRLRQEAREAYHGSIGRWKREIDRDPAILHAWHEFEENAARRAARDFLAKHGIEPMEKRPKGVS